MVFVPAMGTIIATFILLLSVPTLIVGVGLILGKSWAQRFVPIIGALNLANIPFGTVVGAYALWVSMRKAV